jgi:hypothetical protein
LSGLKGSKPRSKTGGFSAGVQKGFDFFPKPESAGLFMVLVTVLAFCAGQVRQELSLTLLGAVFLAVLTYCFITVLLTGFFNKKHARLFKAEITAKLVTSGGTGEIRVLPNGGKRRFFRLPGTFIRYEMKLKTRDERELRCVFDPGGKEGGAVFPVRERGAYFGGADEFAVYDGPGFFRFAFPVRCERLLLAAPPAVEEFVPMPVRSGGTEERTEPHYRKTDDLTDHRPYIPGDDPRRINWKLYGHGPLGELFVREGEPEPPPHSRLVLLLDTQTDASLYTAEEGRRAVDLLCSNALAAALEFSFRGIDVLIGHTGGKLSAGNTLNITAKPPDLPAALAWPAAVPLNSGEDLPDPPDGRGVLILALPRLSAESSALDRYLNRRHGQGAEIFFLYDTKSKRAEDLENAATACVSFFNRRQHVTAHRAGL